MLDTWTENLKLISEGVSIKTLNSMNINSFIGTRRLLVVERLSVSENARNVNPSQGYVIIFNCFSVTNYYWCTLYYVDCRIRRLGFQKIQKQWFWNISVSENDGIVFEIVLTLTNVAVCSCLLYWLLENERRMSRQIHGLIAILVIIHEIFSLAIGLRTSLIEYALAKTEEYSSDVIQLWTYPASCKKIGRIITR